MILIHDIVEIDAGDTYAYDEEGLKTQKSRERVRNHHHCKNTGQNMEKLYIPRLYNRTEKSADDIKPPKNGDKIRDLKIPPHGKSRKTNR